MQPSKAWVKSCEIKGSGHEMAAMMLMIILIMHPGFEGHTLYTAQLFLNELLQNIYFSQNVKLVYI